MSVETGVLRSRNQLETTTRADVNTGLKRSLEECVTGNIAVRSSFGGCEAYRQGIPVSFVLLSRPFSQQTRDRLGIAGDDTILADTVQFDNNRILPRSIVGHRHLLRPTNAPQARMFPVLPCKAPCHESCSDCEEPFCRQAVHPRQNSTIKAHAGAVRISIMKLLVFALLLVTMVSCSDEQQESDRKFRSVLSWSATAAMILEARQKSIVPEGFTRLSLKRCRTEIDNIAQQLTKTASQDLSVQIAGLNKVIATALEDVESGRNQDAARQLENVRRMQQALKARSGASK
ncbi:hypothetical protein [Rhizobium sp. YTU87027]|uniref:hypothetical protein n=1 Tax=Rhizobium sp. YTU87027 TaxID=3417741 RepID=UPI003D68A607